MDSLPQALGFAIRALRRRPGFTTVAVLTLALSIGANATMFSVVNTVVLGPLPFVTPDRVVQLWNNYPNQTREQWPMSQPNFRDYQSQNTVFERFAAVRSTVLYTEGEDRVTPLRVLHASADLVDMIGVEPIRGRTFRAEEDTGGVGNLIMLTHAYWLREFGGADVIGQGITYLGADLQEVEFEVVGVLPPDFRVPPLRMGTDYGVLTEPDVLLPMGLWNWRRDDRGSHSISILAQLIDGVTVEQARSNLQAIAAGIAEIAPETETGLEVTVIPVKELLRQEYAVALGFLWAATALVLLVACASVSSLLLGWGVAREQELAVRWALGAGSRRIFGQLLAEAAILVGAACALGLLLAYWGIAALESLVPAGVHRLDEVSLDVRVVGLTIGMSLLTVALVGLWPALRGARRHSTEALRAGGRTATLARMRSLRILVTAEVALSLVLLSGAGLLLRSFWNLVGVPTGVDERVVLVGIRTPPGPLSKYQGPTGAGQLFVQLRERVEAIPGVTAFALGQGRPLSGSPWAYTPITMVDRARPDAGERPRADWRNVSPGYFRALGIQLLEGRTWDIDEWAAEVTTPDYSFVPRASDPRDPAYVSRMLDPRPIVISAGMARTFWPGESALGKIFHFGDQDPAVLAETLGRVGRSERWDRRYPPPVPLEVIGVVADVRNTLRGEPVPTYYQPSAVGGSLFVRTSMEPAVTAEVLRREIEAVDPSEIEVTRFRTVGQLVAERSADSRFRALLVVLFAVVATGITCLGLFGVLTYAVAQRTSEFGLRMALGADRPKIAGLVLNQGARMAGLGVAWGFVLVVWLTRYLSSLLFGVEPLDPTTLIGVSGLIFGLALLAMYLPARRAMRVDPITALRHE